MQRVKAKAGVTVSLEQGLLQAYKQASCTHRLGVQGSLLRVSHLCHSCLTNRGLEACDLQEIQVSTSSSLVDAPSRHLPVITNSMKGGRTQSESPNHFMTESLPWTDKRFRHTCKHCAQLGPGRPAQGAVRVCSDSTTSTFYESNRAPRYLRRPV